MRRIKSQSEIIVVYGHDGGVSAANKAEIYRNYHPRSNIYINDKARGNSSK